MWNRIFARPSSKYEVESPLKHMDSGTERSQGWNVAKRSFGPDASTTFLGTTEGRTRLRPTVSDPASSPMTDSRSVQVAPGGCIPNATVLRTSASRSTLCSRAEESEAKFRTNSQQQEKMNDVSKPTFLEKTGIFDTRVKSNSKHQLYRANIEDDIKNRRILAKPQLDYIKTLSKPDIFALITLFNKSIVLTANEERRGGEMDEIPNPPPARVRDGTQRSDYRVVPNPLSETEWRIEIKKRRESNPYTEFL